MTGRRADLDKDPAAVAAMFDEVAPRYDLTNAVLSMGQERAWRKATARAVGLQAGEWVLDVAGGTGTSTAALTRDGGRAVACDFSQGMLRAGAAKRRGEVGFVAGDALHLPFADATVDAVTISFGLRNLVDPDAGLAEMLRVVRPGGRLVVCEFSHPTWTPFRKVYLGYLLRALPAMAERVSSDPAAYRYLAESIVGWPDQTELADRIEAAGWSQVSWRDLSGGIVAVHRARRRE